MGIETVVPFYKGDYKSRRIDIQRIMQMTLDAIEREEYDIKIDKEIISICKRFLGTIKEKKRIVEEFEWEHFPSSLGEFANSEISVPFTQKLEEDMRAIREIEYMENGLDTKMMKLKSKDDEIIKNFFESLKAMPDVLKRIRESLPEYGRNYIDFMCHINDQEKIDELLKKIKEDLRTDDLIDRVNRKLEEERNYLEKDIFRRVNFLTKNRADIRKLHSMNGRFGSRQEQQRYNDYYRYMIYLREAIPNLKDKLLEVFKEQEKLIKDIRKKEELKIGVIRIVEVITAKLLKPEKEVKQIMREKGYALST